MAYVYFLPKAYISTFLQKGIHYCTAHKFQTYQQIWFLLYVQ